MLGISDTVCIYTCAPSHFIEDSSEIVFHYHIVFFCLKKNQYVHIAKEASLIFLKVRAFLTCALLFPAAMFGSMK